MDIAHSQHLRLICPYLFGFVLCFFVCERATLQWWYTYTHCVGIVSKGVRLETLTLNNFRGFGRWLKTNKHHKHTTEDKTIVCDCRNSNNYFKRDDIKHNSTTDSQREEGGGVFSWREKTNTRLPQCVSMKWTLLRIVGTQQIFSMEMGMGQMESRTNQMHRTSVEKKRIQRTTTTASTTMKRRGWTECGRARGKKKNKTKVITWICHLIYNLCLTFYVSALCCSLNCTRSRGTQYLFRKARKQWPDFFSFSFVLSISLTRARFVSRIWLRKGPSLAFD